MNPSTQIDQLKAQLDRCVETRDEYLEQRNSARQLAYDLAGALEYWRKNHGLPLEQEKLMRVMDRALGKGGYSWPDGVKAK